MKLSELGDYQRRNPHRVPADTVIAYPEPLEKGFVLQYDKWNFVVEQELTRQEFMAILRENQRHADVVTGTAELHGSRLDMAGGRDAVEPGPEFRYFYLVRRL